MDLPLQMPRPRCCKTPLASAILGISKLEFPVRSVHFCSVSAAPLQRVTLGSWRHSWCDGRILEGGYKDRGAPWRRVERLQILSRYATGLGANRSKGKSRNSLPIWRKDDPGESAGSTKSPSLATGKVGKRGKTGVQPSITDVAKEPSLFKLKSKSNTSLSVTDTPHRVIASKGISSRAVSAATPKQFASEKSSHTDTPHRVIASKGISSIADSGATPKKLGSERSSQTASLGAEPKEGESNSSMESATNGPRLSKRAKKNPEEAQLFWRLNMCSKNADLHGALEIYDKVKKEGVFQLKQFNYNVLLYICSGAASGSLIIGKSGKDTSKQADNDIQRSDTVTVMHSEPLTDVMCRDSKPSMGDINGAAGDEEDAKEATALEEVHFSPEDMQLAAQRGIEIYEDMLQRNVPLNEATFTSIARLAAAKGDGDLAFEMVKQMAAANIAPKLRSYGPALLSFCKDNEVEKAFKVDNHMLAAGVLPDESLLEALLKVSMEAGLHDKVYSLLQRIRTTVRALSSTTVETIERWFNSEAAVFAGKDMWDSLPSNEELKAAIEAGGGGWHGLGWLGKGKWKVRRTNINKTGSCLSCGEQLCTIDLDPEETENFANSVAELACQRENKSSDFFKAFQIWLHKHGPFDAVIDGANVGLYNPHLSQGFNFHQVNAVANAVRARSPTSRSPLVILHRRRTKDKSALSEKAQSMLKRWNQANTLYSTPHGSNDDWYWLYAAVKSKCLLVTNDEMRDHLFELLGNDFFPKWKERHQVRFTFTTTALELHMPPPYSIVIQESPSGSWHIPQSGGDDITAPREWLCVTRPDPVHVVRASAEDVSCHQKDYAKMPQSYLKKLATELEVEVVNKKLRNVDMESSLDNANSTTSFQKVTGDSGLGSTSPPLRSSRSNITRKQLLSDSSPVGSKIIAKLEAAEECAKCAIDFQI